MPIHSLLQSISDVGVALARLDARASLWFDGELVHLEDLVLHDAGMISEALDVTPRAARRVAGKPGAREMTGGDDSALGDRCKGGRL